MMEEALNSHMSKADHDRTEPKDGQTINHSPNHVDNTAPKTSTSNGFEPENFPMMEEVLNGHASKENVNGHVPNEGVPLKKTPVHQDAITQHRPSLNALAPENFPMLEDELISVHKHDGAAMHRAKHPEKTNAYLVGGGIASLAAAIHLIQDAHVPGPQIHIIESSSVPGGSMDGAGNAQDGYRLRGGRMLNFSYVCLYDLLSTIPSLSDPAKTVMDEVNEFNAIPENKTHARARLVAKGATGPEIVDVKQMGLTARDRHDLVHMTMEAEHRLGTKRIEDCFEKPFFHTKFWYMWATM